LAWLRDDARFTFWPSSFSSCVVFGVPSFGGTTFYWLGTVVTHAVFFGEDRYHVVVTPMLSPRGGSLAKDAENHLHRPHEAGTEPRRRRKALSYLEDERP